MNAQSVEKVFASMGFARILARRGLMAAKVPTGRMATSAITALRPLNSASLRITGAARRHRPTGNVKKWRTRRNIMDELLRSEVIDAELAEPKELTEREKWITALRALAKFYEDTPELPVSVSN